MTNIRPVEEKDLPILGEIFAKTYEVFDVGERWTPETAQTLLTYWFKKQPDLAFVAEVDGKAVGAFFSTIKPWWDGNHLFDGEIFVHPDFQKHGVGSALLKRMFTEARDNYQARMFDAFTFKGFEHPLSWYKRLGFKEVEEWTIISGSIEETLKKLEE